MNIIHTSFRKNIKPEEVICTLRVSYARVESLKQSEIYHSDFDSRGFILAETGCL